VKELEFMELLSELPPEYIEAAAGPQKKRRGIIFRKHYGIPVIAACLVVIIAAAIYPRLRVEKPEQVPEPEQTTYTTTVAETVPYEAEETAVTATTRRDAAAEQTVTALQTAAAERTAADGTRDTEPAQTAASAQNAAPAQQTAQNHAAAGSSATSAKTTAPAKTTAKTTASAKTNAKTTASARTTAKTTASARTTAKTTALPRTTTMAITRMTAPPARTTAPNMITTAMAARTEAMTTPVTRRTAGPPPAVTTAVLETEAAATAQTTARDGSSGGGHWHPGSPGEDPWSGWHHSGHGVQPPTNTEPFDVFFLQAIVPAEADEYLDGMAVFGQLEYGGGFIMPDAFVGYSLPDGMDPANYNVLPMYYYGYICDAVVTGAEYSGFSMFEPSVCILETGETFRKFIALFWIPKEITVSPADCAANIAVEWNADSFYGDLPDPGDTLFIRPAD